MIYLCKFVKEVNYFNFLNSFNFKLFKRLLERLPDALLSVLVQCDFNHRASIAIAYR